MPEDLEIHLRRRAVADQTGQRTRLPGNLRQLGATGRVTAPSSPGSQRCTVKINVVSCRGTGQRVAYLQYDKVEKQRLYPLYGPGSGDPSAFVRTAKHDHHQYHLMISPESQGLTNDQRTAFVEGLARQMERDVGRELIWVAANHYDTAHGHTHLLLRGGAQGEEWYMSRHYFEQGIRARAERLLTMLLGQTQQQVPQIQLTQRYAQERQVMDGLVRGYVGDPDVLRVQRQQTQGGAGLGRSLAPYGHDHSGVAMRAELAQLQHRTQALQEQQRQHQGGWRYGH